MSGPTSDSTSLSTAMSGLESESTSLNTLVTASQKESATINNNEEKVVNLPDTGKNLNNETGLIAAALTMLAGLGLIRKSKKDKKHNKDEV
ncbi:LPXTG cell wall anchor domain-containing protein [Staphylococcus casei]|uniref:LPXTG cell wall anchor domain-containing protein n=1 Tax=Staphylococcus casei TaxID=201828 RepID=UPI002570024B|nr:LPXTG cell wall anchor domain-containing protein [Staphylococcus casei]WJE86571.1 LPXTG cell wall anchor domain-containing protein [Staphylococcus casei]